MSTHALLHIHDSTHVGRFGERGFGDLAGFGSREKPAGMAERFDIILKLSLSDAVRISMSEVLQTGVPIGVAPFSDCLLGI